MNGNRQFANLPPQDVLTALGECLPDLVFLIDEDGRYHAILGGTDRQRYHEAEHLLGQRFHDVMPKDFADRMLAEVRKALESGELNTTRYALGPHDVQGYAERAGPQTPQWYEARISPVPERYPGRRYVVATVFNINDRVHAEAALKRMAYTDELTGLPNRRAFRRFGRRLLHAMRQSGRDLAVALVDVDHFKRINDRFGHHAGDAALRDFASALIGNLREEDYVARIGGEEFAFLLPDCSASDGSLLLERVRKSIRGTEFRFGDTVFSLSFSAGVASTGRNEPESVDALLKAADGKLYAAKTKGRDRVEWGSA